MAAFDITTKPTKLEIKAGSTGSIMVVVSNRTGKPVMGLVEGVLTPATVAKWLISPAPTELQRRYEADPAATVQLEFKVAVPEDAVDQDVQFQAIARDVLLPDDNKAEGQVAAIKVIAKEKILEVKPKIPVWVWLIAGLVLVGAALGLWLLLRPRGVPNVVGKTPEKAISILTDKGFAPVNRQDTVGKQDKDTNLVIRQEPKAKSKLPDKKDTVKTAALIVVNRQGVEIPAGIVNQPYGTAANELQALGLGVKFGSQSTRDTSLEHKVATTNPPPGGKVPVGSTVELIVYRFVSRPPLRCPPFCFIEPLKVIPQGREP